MEYCLVTFRNDCEGYVVTPVCQSFCSQGGSTSVHAGIPTPPQSRPPQGPGTPSPRAGTPGADTPRDQAPPPAADGYCCGRYASYWNAFLFWRSFHSQERQRRSCHAKYKHLQQNMNHLYISEEVGLEGNEEGHA